MKILYGVQGTGNGHITRARMMAEAFKKHPVTVDFLFSGKDDPYFNMEPFGDYKTCKGLSFVAEHGSIKYYKSFKRNDISQFIRDIKSLNVKQYDLVITDFEPITAWAAKINKVPCIGLSHQNAFRYKVPVRGQNLIARLVLKWFAPANQQLGLHWHHFNQSILPPMIKTDLVMRPVDKRKILVYLPFIQLNRYHDLFHRFPDYNFVQYHPVKFAGTRANVIFNPLSREKFLQDFSDCSGVICSAGFGACSEAIHYGKKLFVIPLMGQMEQLSNAAALEQLGYATVTQKIKRKKLQQWLDKPAPRKNSFPDVAQEITQWIIDGRRLSLQHLSQKLWLSVSASEQHRKSNRERTEPNFVLPNT